MNLMQNIGFWCLVVTVALLLWRVWRLEDRAKGNEAQAAWLLECIQCRAHKEAVDALSQRVAGYLASVRQLARALGYEWKRTDAKEGWEKKNPFGVGDMFSYYKALDAYLTPIRPVGMDRRKADRRKPAPQAAPKSSPKKPRRAH